MKKRTQKEPPGDKHIRTGGLGQNDTRFFSVRRVFILCISIAYILLSMRSADASGEIIDEFFKEDDAQAPWHITADQINHNQKTDEYSAWGNVTITKNKKKLAADYVRFNQKTMDVFAEGHVVITAGRDILTGTRVEMNLQEEVGTVYQGMIFFDANHFYIQGETIRKVGQQSYTINKGTVTTCDGDHPAWKITGRDLNVTIEGYGTIKHATLWAKEIPVLYSPFLAFPVKLKRQSGVLPPQIGFSDRKGTEFILPFFWAINENSDATVYGHYMGHRGNKIGLEYRYVLDNTSKGTLVADGFADRKTDDGTGESSEKWGYTDDGTLRPNSDRYWFRTKLDQAMPLGFMAKLDLDIVSDQDYLQEFKDGYTGFDWTKQYYNDAFYRDLDDYNDPVRVNRLNFSKNWSKYSLNADLRWYDNVINRRQSETDTTIQKLPVVTFNGSKQPVFNTAAYFDLNSEYTYFFRQDGDKGHRMDVHPRLYYPFRFKNYFTFEPSAGMRETVWRIDEDETTSFQNDLKPHREIYDITLDLSTQIFRLFNVNSKNIDRLQHTVLPQVTYEYIPDQTQDNLPYFDSTDRIERKSLLTFAVTNTMTSRSPADRTNLEEQKISNSDGERESPAAGYTYRQICRFKLSQLYDINKANENDPEPFSPIKGEIELSPSRYVSLQADAEWSRYDNAFPSHNVATSFSDRRGDRIFAEHRYTENINESIYMDLLYVVSKRLSVYTAYERNIKDKRDIKTELGLLYQSQCWSLKVKYTDEADDQKYAFVINLYGLGEVGQSFGFKKRETETFN